MNMVCRYLLVSLVVLSFANNKLAAAASQETESKPAAETQPANDDAATKPAAASVEQVEKFKKGLSNTKFVGQFTITGMEDKTPRQEEYTITTVTKLEKGDWWEITARIKYGDHDLTVPMRMEVKWADKTPVITVDRLFIPGLGTFDARVLLRKDKYAGTWAHDDVGGHLFGKIIKLDANAAEEGSAKNANTEGNEKMEGRENKRK